MLIPSAGLSVSTRLGGPVDAVLLRSTPAALFERMVPFLILFATVLFTVQGPIQKRLRGASAANI